MSIQLKSAHSQWHAYRLEDRHVPWKVFLPVSAEKPILAIGLNGAELASLARSCGVIDVYRCSEADIEWAKEQLQNIGRECILDPITALRGDRESYFAIAINADGREVLDIRKVSTLLARGGTAAWIGRRKAHVPSAESLIKWGFSNIQRHAVLPPSNGKILVSLENRKLTRGALNLYIPGKWHNRLQVRMAALVAAIGAQGLLGFKQVVTAKKNGYLEDNEYLLEWLEKKLANSVTGVGVYTGWSKLVLQLFDRGHNVFAIAKVGDMTLGRQDIIRESNTLMRLRDVTELRNSIPKVLYIGEWKDHSIQVQTATEVSYGRFTTNLTRTHLNFLGVLSRLDRSEMFLEQWPHWPKIWQWVHEGDILFSRESREICKSLKGCSDTLAKQKIIFHRVHGDFSPWHAFLSPQGLAVIDWEKSQAVGLPLFDAAHFVMKRDIYAGKKLQSFEKLAAYYVLILRIADELKALNPSLNIIPEVAYLATLLAYLMLKYPEFGRWIWADQ